MSGTNGSRQTPASVRDEPRQARECYGWVSPGLLRPASVRNGSSQTRGNRVGRTVKCLTGGSKQFLWKTMVLEGKNMKKSRKIMVFILFFSSNSKPSAGMQHRASLMYLETYFFLRKCIVMEFCLI